MEEYKKKITEMLNDLNENELRKVYTIVLVYIHKENRELCKNKSI